MRKKQKQVCDYLLNVKDLSFKFGRQKILEDINFTVKAGESTSLIGPSGSGKTTLLRICSGLLEAEKGIVDIHYKNIGFMFQTPRLLPWEKAHKNIMIGLQARHKPYEESMTKVIAIAEKLGLTEDDLDKYPYQLSGGMQSRVAMCRALIINPDILFLDEPFTGLDIGLKRELMTALKHEVKKSTSLLMITHDLTEAIELTDTIMVLYGEPGRIELEYKIETAIERRNPTFINIELDKLLRKKEIKQAYGLL